MFKGVTNEPLNISREEMLKIEKEFQKNPNFAGDSIRIRCVSAKELYDDIVEHGGSYDIIGGLETLRRLVEEEEDGSGKNK